jgi:hypothetical protein
MSHEPKILALAAHLNVNPDTIEESRYGSDMFTCTEAPGEYRVLTDDEADTAWDESLESYIDDVLLPECGSETLKRYFDREAWKRDARYDGRGHCLSSYDSEEHEERIEGEYYYIYRIN